MESKTKVKISEVITVKDLAAALDVKVSQLITQLMKQGVMAAMTQTIDFNTAAQAAEALGIQVEPAGVDLVKVSHTKIAASKQGEIRPPVVAVMGHVDHGKTSILDVIRHTNVVSKEAGGITQHLSAYQIDYKGHLVTFIDTPGHEAFSILREHGAYLTDIALLVVAADDGVKPQTEEAIKFATKAGVRIIVAINKIDKPGVDINRVKQELAKAGLNPEEWGGDTVMVEVSAKTGEGIDKLMDLVLLVAELEDLKARGSGPAEGTVIESHLDSGKGPATTLLVAVGSLAVGDYIIAGKAIGKVRRLETTEGKALMSAAPATPVVVTGWKELPALGERFKVVESEKAARSQALLAATEVKPISPTTAETVGTTRHELAIILKADAQGSLDSLSQSLSQFREGEVRLNIVAQSLGAVTESDVNLAKSTKATVIGFNITLSVQLKQLAAREKVKIQIYKIIYELLDDIKATLSAMLAPETIETTQAKLEVKGIFKVSANTLVCGGLVKEGKLTAGLLTRWLHSDKSEEIGSVTSVQKNQQDIKEVVEGEMCGISIKTNRKIALQIGDRLEFFSRETRERSL